MMRRTFVYSFRDRRGDLVEAVVVEPGSLFVRTFAGAYATYFDAPGPCLRSFLAHDASAPGVTMRFEQRLGCQRAVSQAVRRAVAQDVESFWEPFRAELFAELASEEAARQESSRVPRAREPLALDRETAEELGYVALYAKREGPWRYLDRWVEEAKHGCLITALFHREGDPEDEAWEGRFEVQGEEIVEVETTFSLLPRRRVVREER